METTNSRVALANLLILFSLFAILVGCQKKAAEPEAVVEEQGIPGGEIDDLVAVMLDGRRFPVDGESWKVTLENVENVLVHDTRENEDGSLTADVSFESLQEGRGIAIDTLIRYEVQIVGIVNRPGKIATHNVTGLQPKSVEKIGDWAKE